MAWFMYIFSMIVPCMAKLCEFYFYDGSQMRVRTYYKYCLDGCCDNNCCYYHKSSSDSEERALTYSPISLIILIAGGCLVGLELPIALLCVFKYCCKSEVSRAGQITRHQGNRSPMYKNMYRPVGAIIGVTVGCLVGLGLCIAICLCVFKLCCRSEAAQAGQIIQQPGQQVAYVCSQTASGSSYGQQVHMAYGYHGQKFDDIGPPPAYEDSLSHSLPTNPPSYNATSPGDVVTLDDTNIEQRAQLTQVATVLDNNMTSSSSEPHVAQTTSSDDAVTTDDTSTEHGFQFTQITTDNNMTPTTSSPEVT